MSKQAEDIQLIDDYPFIGAMLHPFDADTYVLSVYYSIIPVSADNPLIAPIKRWTELDGVTWLDSCIEPDDNMVGGKAIYESWVVPARLVAQVIVTV